MRATCDFRSRWRRSRTNDGALRGRVAREILLDKGDRDTALANSGRNAGLDKIWVAACRGAVGVSEGFVKLPCGESRRFAPQGVIRLLQPPSAMCPSAQRAARGAADVRWRWTLKML